MIWNQFLLPYCQTSKLLPDTWGAQHLAGGNWFPIRPAHHIHSKLTHSSVSRRSTQTSNGTKQRSNWAEAGLLRGCTSVQAWLCSLVQDLDSRQSLTVRGGSRRVVPLIFTCMCVLSPLARVISQTLVMTVTVHLFNRSSGQDAVRFVINQNLLLWSSCLLKWILNDCIKKKKSFILIECVFSSLMLSNLLIFLYAEHWKWT